MELLLNSKQTADLANLLDTVSAQVRLGSGYRNEAGYWATEVGPRPERGRHAAYRLAVGGRCRLCLANGRDAAMGHGLGPDHHGADKWREGAVVPQPGARPRPEGAQQAVLSPGTVMVSTPTWCAPGPP